MLSEVCHFLAYNFLALYVILHCRILITNAEVYTNLEHICSFNRYSRCTAFFHITNNKRSLDQKIDMFVSSRPVVNIGLSVSSSQVGFDFVIAALRALRYYKS